MSRIAAAAVAGRLAGTLLGDWRGGIHRYTIGKHGALLTAKLLTIENRTMPHDTIEIETQDGRYSAHVYQPEGGILKYLEEIPESESLWTGECFVFDERVSVDENLQKGTAEDLSVKLKGEK